MNSKIEAAKTVANQQFEEAKAKAAELEGQAEMLAREHKRKSEEIMVAHKEVVSEMERLRGEWRGYDKLTQDNGEGDSLGKGRVKQTLDHQKKKKK